MKPLRSLRHKFVRTLLLVSALIALPTLLIVAYFSAQASSRNLRVVQSQIEQAIVSKGKVLTANHALALRTMTLENSFGNMQSLVEEAVSKDSDLVYGIYVDAEGRTLAFSVSGATARDDLPPRSDAWKQLGLTADQAYSRTQIIRKASVFGGEVYEVAIPVAGENPSDPPLGMVRYGLSTRRMSEALNSAKADARRDLTKSLLLLCLTIGIATALGLMLSHSHAKKITQPVSELTNAANSLAGGDHRIRVGITSGDELEQLGASFNAMVEQLEASYRDLAAMNRTLEHKVEERTTELSRKNRDMRLVLDTVDQGFITLSAAGVMATERSGIADEWFGPCDGVCTLGEYVGRISRQFRTQFEIAWEQFAEGFLPVDVCIEQLPKRVAANGRTWTFRYLPFMQDDVMEGCLVVISDDTEKLARERDDAVQHELMQGFKRLMMDRSGFASFINEADEMVLLIRNWDSSSEMRQVQRTLHTLKGNAGVMGLTIVAQLCHKLEDYLADEGILPSDILCELVERWRLFKEHVAQFVPPPSQTVVEIPESEYAALIARLSASQNAPGIMSQLLAWQLEPVSRRFEALGAQAKGVAQRLGKGELEVVIDDGSLRFDPAEWTQFFSVMTHLVRNAVDHGIETSAERAAAGKPCPGVLAFAARQSATSVTFEIRDDGRGIDWDAVKQRALEHGLAVANREDLVQALFAAGITTKAEASAISGRGVGLAAVKECVERMEGSIRVMSARGVGTTWTVEFPINASAGLRVNRRGAADSVPPRARRFDAGVRT